MKREPITVGVSRRILWIGAAAYPLQNIARAQTFEIMPNRARATMHYLLQVVLWLTLGVGGQAALERSDLSSSDAGNLAGLTYTVLAVLLIISTVRWLLTLFRRPLYAMVIETAGSPQTALVSTSEAEVSSLVRQTMDAIDDPGAHFNYTVHNITSVGEQYNISGRQNIGKRVSS